VLVIGAEKLSTIVDWQDRNTCVLFGDGAGAVILQTRPTRMAVDRRDGRGWQQGRLLLMPAAAAVAGHERFRPRADALPADGVQGHFQKRVQAMLSAAQEVLRRCELKITDIKCVIPHQAIGESSRPLASDSARLRDQLFINLDRYGNTSAASVAIALERGGFNQEIIARGDLILLVVFGAGLTWGAAVIEW